MTALQPDELFACLSRHDVRYVLIGGLAGVLHGSPLPTVDADICPSRDRDNLRRLAAALTELDARIRTPDVPAGIPFPRESAFLARIELLNLTTRFGDLDLSFVPAGTAGYDDLARGVETMTIRSIVVPVAGLQQAHRVSGHCARHPVTSCICHCRPMR